MTATVLSSVSRLSRLGGLDHLLRGEALVADLSSVRVYAAAQRCNRGIEAVDVLVAYALRGLELFGSMAKSLPHRDDVNLQRRPFPSFSPTPF